MTSGIEFNKSYTSSYIIMPLNKNNGKMTVQSTDKEAESRINLKNSMTNFDELKQVDADRNGIISLDELKNYKNKTEFMENLERAMEKFNANPNNDYTKNLFEEWV